MRSQIFIVAGWVALAVGVGAVELGLVTAVPALRTGLQLGLLVSFLLALFYSHGAAMVAAVISGYWLDLHSGLTFGLFTVSVVSAVFFCVVLRTRVLKHEAGYAMAISVFISTAVFWMVYLLLVAADAALSSFAVPSGWYRSFLLTAVWQSVVHTVAILVVFHLRKVLGGRFVSLEGKSV